MAEADERNARLEAYGAHLRRRRQDAGYRFANQFAGRVGITPQYLSDLERGYATSARPSREPSDVVLDAIARVLDWPKRDQLAVIRRLDALPPSYLPAEEELYVAAEEDSLTEEDLDEIREYIRMKRERARRRIVSK